VVVDLDADDVGEDAVIPELAGELVGGPAGPEQVRSRSSKTSMKMATRTWVRRWEVVVIVSPG
jgi:hypothetical protein